MSDPNPRPVPPPPIPPPPPIQPPPDEPERKGAGTLVWILLLIALLAFGWYFFNQRGAEAPPTEPAAPPAVGIGSEEEAAAERERQATAEREAREAAAEEPEPAAAADRDPAPLTRVEPEYPPAAARAREEGTVLVTASIDAQGTPVDVTVTRRSGSRDLDNAAVAAVRKWTFEPAIRGGQPAASQVEVPVEFSLDR